MEKLICDVVSMKALAKPISETQEIKIMFIIILLLESSKDGMTFQGCSKLGQAPQAFIPLWGSATGYTLLQEWGQLGGCTKGEDSWRP